MAVPGVTRMLVSVCLTITLMVNDAVLPLGWPFNRYVPAIPKVTVVVALVVAKVGAGAPAGSVVAVHTIPAKEVRIALPN